MASCHTRAVMLRRQEYRDETNYNIALVVAMHMGSDGRPATVSLATIAEYAHCHYNTADKRTKQMSDLGQLHIEKNGKMLTYLVPFDGDEDGEPEGRKPAGGDSGEVSQLRREVAGLKTELVELTAVVTSLSHHLHTIVTPPSHDVHMVVTPPSTDNVNEVGKKGRSRSEEGGTPLPPKRPSLPIHLATEAMMEVWELWLDHQERAVGKPLSEFTAKRQIKIIEGMGVPRAIAALNHSMDQNYKGIVEPKPAVNGHRSPPAQPRGLSAVEEYARRQQLKQ